MFWTPNDFILLGKPIPVLSNASVSGLMDEVGNAVEYRNQELIIFEEQSLLRLISHLKMAVF